MRFCVTFSSYYNSMVSVQQTNLLPENASQIHNIFHKSLYRMLYKTYIDVIPTYTLLQ